MLVNCSGSQCKSDYQDKKHGKGVRVYNPKKDGTFYCTVCGNTIQPKK